MPRPKPESGGTTTRNRAQARPFLDDAVDPRRASGWVVAGCLGFLTTGSVLRHPPVVIADVGITVGGVLLGVVVVLLMARVALMIERAVLRGLTMTVAYGLAELVRTLSYDYGVAGRSPADLGASLLAGFLTGAAVIGTVTAVLTGSREYRAHLARLLASRAALERMRDEVRVATRRERDQLLTETRAVLDHAFSEALREAERTGDAAGAVLQLVDSSIRPLSRRLSVIAEIEDGPSGIALPDVRVSPARVLRAAVRADPFDPRPLLAITVVLALGRALFWPGTGGAAEGLLWLGSILLVMSAPFLIARVMLERRMENRPLAVQAILVAMTSVTAMIGAVIVDVAIRGSGGGLMLLYAAAVGLGMVVILGLIRGLGVVRAEVLTELGETTDRVRRMTGRATALAWSEQRELARAVHRDIQAAAIAAAWRYSLHAAEPERAADALDELRTTIGDAVRGLTLNPAVPTTAEIVQRTRATWEEICALEVELEPAVADELDRDADARRIVAELLAEFMTNAVKHGRAGSARAVFTVIDHSSLAFTFWNDGVPIDPTSARGMGMHEIMRRSLALTVENRPDGVLFRLVLSR